MIGADKKCCSKIWSGFAINEVNFQRRIGGSIPPLAIPIHYERLAERASKIERSHHKTLHRRNSSSRADPPMIQWIFMLAKDDSKIDPLNTKDKARQF